MTKQKAKFWDFDNFVVGVKGLLVSIIMVFLFVPLLAISFLFSLTIIPILIGFIFMVFINYFIWGYLAKLFWGWN